MRLSNSRLELAALAAAVVGLLALSGCASGPVNQRAEPRLLVNGASAPASLVFSDPRVSLALVDGPELTRRDADLSNGLASAQQARDEWPGPDRPSLRNFRRLQLNQRPETFLYFERAEDRSGGRGGWGEDPGHGSGGHWRGRDWRSGW